ncbi:TetR/AcrR family transcriptional regulator [Streptomyces aurantiacus]|nr:TetR/AcrR family transcriptional regulator [Streptomyces aurantiacus]
MSTTDAATITPTNAGWRSLDRLGAPSDRVSHTVSGIAYATASAAAAQRTARSCARSRLPTMGVSGPALYRYFANRDELITALIRDAYRSLADTFRAAAESGADVSALAHALRGWAIEDPQRYFLVYGTPVPGYHAPDDVTTIASEIMTTLLDAYAARPSDGRPETPFDAHLEDHRKWADGHPAPSATLHRALSCWTRLHGVLSLELAGHFTGMGFDPALLFTAELNDLT